MATSVLHPQASTKTLSRTASRRFIMAPPSREHISTLSISPPLPLIVTPPPSIKVTPAASSSSASEDQIFTLTDEELSDAYKFEREVGYGNWGSVWLCKRKLNNPGQKVAIKLVHRSKTPTTAARVRSLWNEMKTLKTLPAAHPSLIQFESFIISPSYALVVMPYIERLMPVQLSEDMARPYFRDLISAVSYLHENLITHNDIKPANVLLRDDNVPVLVDFGFATKWEATAVDPFFSTISWGTPEYLSSSRARGMRHDERTSDVWSLGITLFEILTGRTPFEESEQEQFSTPDELQVYYDRTVSGQWVGEWEISVGVEDLLRRMIHPDETLRITAASALKHSSLRDIRTHSQKPLPIQPAPSPPSTLLNVNIGSSSCSIYRDPTASKKNGNMSPPKRTRAGLTTSPSRETLRSNGTARPIRVKAHSPSKKPIAASSPTHRRVVSKAKNAAAHPASPTRVKNHSPAESVATPPKYLRPTNENATLSPTSPPGTKHRNPVRNLGPPGTESPKTRRRHSRVLFDVTVSSGNDQQETVAGQVKAAGKGDRKEQLARKPGQQNGSPRKRASQAEIRAAKVQKSLRDLRETFENGPPGLPEAAALVNGENPLAMPRGQMVSAMEAASLDQRLDRISLWVRNVERIVEEARSTLHDPSLLDESLDSIVSPSTLSPPTSPMHLTAVNATPTRSSLAMMASQIATPTRTLVDGVAVVLPGGRPLADVPESVGQPSPGPRAFSTPPGKEKLVPSERDASPLGQPQGERVYETIAFGGFGRPIDGNAVVAVGEEPVKDSMGRAATGKLRRSKSKLLALFQSSTDPKSTLNGGRETPDPERLSFLKFPPPPPTTSPHTSKPPHYIHARHPSAPSNAQASPSRKPSMKLRLRSSIKSLRKPSGGSSSFASSSRPQPQDNHGIPTPPATPATEHKPEAILLASPEAVTRQGAGWGSPPPVVSQPLSPLESESETPKMDKRKSFKSLRLKGLFIPSSKEELEREREGERERAGTPWTMNSQWTDVTGTEMGTERGSLGGRWMRSLGFKRGRA